MARKLAAVALVALLAGCGVPPAPSAPYAPGAPAAAALGCARTGYVLSSTAAACDTSTRLSATPADLATACAPGWVPCARPPAGCEKLDAYYIAQLAWRPASGPDSAGTCGTGPAGSVTVGLGCGAGAQRSTAPRCGGWTEAADLPWGRGVLCCAVSP